MVIDFEHHYIPVELAHLFATDYPQNFNNTDPKMGKNADGIGEYIETIRKLPLDTKIIDGMLAGTAARLLNLPSLSRMHEVPQVRLY